MAFKIANKDIGNNTKSQNNLHKKCKNGELWKESYIIYPIKEYPCWRFLFFRDPCIWALLLDIFWSYRAIEILAIGAFVVITR